MKRLASISGKLNASLKVPSTDVSRTAQKNPAYRQASKEKGIDLLDPQNREEEALALYYKSLIEYCIDQVAKEFIKIKDRFALPKAIPIVVSGGTSLAGNFLPFFEKVFAKKRRKFPFEISEVRQAVDPMNAVAQGLLIQAVQEYEE